MTSFVHIHLRNLSLIIFLTIVVYFPTMHHGFASWDDDGHLINNVQVREFSINGIKRIFQSEVNWTYIPLTILSFAVEYKFFGYAPWIYHVNNLTLHLGVVVLVYLLALRVRLSATTACWASLLFAVHPMHVESVAWVTQRKDVLYSFFYLLSLWFYVGYGHTQRGVSFLAAIVCAILSVLSKPMALSLPIIFFVFDWFLKRRWGIRIVLEKFPFFLTVWPVAWLTYMMNMRKIDVDGLSAVLTWVWSLSFYISKFIFPVNLLILYQLPKPVAITNPPFAGAIILFLMGVFLIIRWRKHRLFIFALMYFFASIFFLLRFDDVRDLTFVADRFMYLPSLGFCFLFGSLGQWILNKTNFKSSKVLVIILLGLIIGWLAFNAHHRVLTWGNEHLLWKQAEKYSLSGVVYNRLGNYYLGVNDYAKAITYYQKAIVLNPRYHKPYSNRGIAYFKVGNYQAAIADFTQAIELCPLEAATAYNNRGYAYENLGKNNEALHDYDKAIQINPNYVPAYLNRATVYKNQRNFNRALADIKEVLRIEPHNLAAKNNFQILTDFLERSEIFSQHK